MQIHKYSNGGFCIHKITGNFSGRCSAYVDPKGQLIDAEQFCKNNSVRPVKKHGKLWNELQRKVVLQAKRLNEIQQNKS